MMLAEGTHARLDEMVGSGIATIEDVEEVVFGQD